MRLSRSDFIPPFLSRLKRSFVNQFINGGSTGLNGLDLKLIDAISPKPDGYFVELGANDGFRQSNTYKLQKQYNWTGLLIEPSPIRFLECVANRDFGISPQVRCAACVPFNFNERFVEIEDSDLMSVAKGLLVSDENAVNHADSGAEYLTNSLSRHSYGAMARTLTSLLDEVGAPCDFDLLSLDVEGNELAVLLGLDFQRFKPTWILVEARGPEVPSYLMKHGYAKEADLSNYEDYSDILFRRS